MKGNEERIGVDMRNQVGTNGVTARIQLAMHNSKGVGKRDRVGVKLQISEQCFIDCVTLIIIW